MKRSQGNKTATPKPRTLLRWPGNKTRLLPELLPLLDRPHECYAEAFAGALAVFLAKKPSKREIINDINGDIVALYRVAQFHPEELVRELKFVLSARKTVKDFAAQAGLTDVQRAGRLLARNWASFAGGGTSFGVSKTRGASGTIDRAEVERRLEIVRSRMDGHVAVENLSYERLFELYDSPATVWFLDPPYVDADIKAYAGWTQAQMDEFRTRVGKLKGYWIVTINDSETNRALFKGCKLKPVQTVNRCVNHGITPIKTFGELIITPA